MDWVQFKEQIEKDAYKMNEKKMLSGTINSDHTHFFNTQLFMLSSNISTRQRDVETIYGPGFFLQCQYKHKTLRKSWSVNGCYLSSYTKGTITFGAIFGI